VGVWAVRGEKAMIIQDIVKDLARPIPARFLFIKYFDKVFNVIPYEKKFSLRDDRHPSYGYCTWHTAKLAKQLGIGCISLIEFGVAGGKGLCDLEYHADKIHKKTGLNFQIYGFDSGHGLPDVKDYRDMPHLFQKGNFQMDRDKLLSRLNTAKLIEGDVNITIKSFFTKYNPAPIGFISFDLDLYSSTIEALRIFDADISHFLPRVACHFDDIIGGMNRAHNQYTGELLAINEFNEGHIKIKISKVEGLQYFAKVVCLWHGKIFITHFFDHPLYGVPIGEHTQLPL
jgi:hypothetical protein